MNQVTEKEYPNCNRCGMHKLKVDSQLKCPNCDTYSEPSGLVANTPDPGVEGFVKKVITGTDGKSYEVMVAAESTDAPRQSIPIKINNVPADAVLPQADVVAEIKERPVLLLKALRLIFEQHPARTMGEFKRLKKVRDAIDKLEFLINNIKGE